MSVAPVLTIDGPSGVGKGTVARVIAAEQGWRLLDSGALYRILALAAVDAGLKLNDEAGVATETSLWTGCYTPRELRLLCDLTGLDVDDMMAGLLVSEGFSSIEEIAFVEVEELMDIEGIDEEVGQELQARAQDYLEEEAKKLDARRKELGGDVVQSVHVL